jgi:tetratricopeptide (TPR) repeat protein
MKKAIYDKANQRRTIIMALGITVLEFLILVGIVSAGESSNALQSSNAWVHKGDELLCSAKFTEALAAYDKAIEINPKNEKAWLHKAAHLLSSEKYNEALEAYNKVI